MSVHERLERQLANSNRVLYLSMFVLSVPPGQTVPDNRQVISSCTSFMHSSTPLRVLRARTSKQVAPRRFASHGAPHYNEPSGYLFGEKVMTNVAVAMLHVH